LFDAFEVTMRKKRALFIKVIAACLLAFIIAPPIAQAAAQRIKGTVTAKIKDSSGGAIDSTKVDPMGLFGAAGSSGALAVRNFAGGGGFLGAADCTETTDDGLTNSVTVTDAIVTGIIITGSNATYTVTAEAVGAGQLPLANWTVDAQNPDVFVGLGNGLTATDAITWTCTAGNSGNLIVLGQ